MTQSQNDSRKEEAEKLILQGIQQAQSGQFQNAFQAWQTALNIYREIKDRTGEARVLVNLGTVYGSQGNYSEAIASLKQALDVSRGIKNAELEAKSFGNLGIIYRSQGNYPEAITHLQRALEIAKEIPDPQSASQIKSFCSSNLGVVYRIIGNYFQSIDYFERAIRIAKEIQDSRAEMTALGNLGNTYYSLGDYQKAIENHQQALAITKERKYLLEEGATLGNLGNAYYSLGDYQKAIEYQEQSLTVANKISNPQGQARSLTSLGSNYNSLKDYQRAIKYHQQALAIFQQIEDRQGEGATLGNFGAVYDLLGDYPEAIIYHQRALTIAREIKDRQEEGKALNNLGVTLHKSGKLLGAEEKLCEAIQVWNSLREELKDEHKISIFEQQAMTYRELQQVLIAQNKINKALGIAEQGRARALVNLLSRRFELQKSVQTAIKSPSIERIRQIAVEQQATLVEYSLIQTRGIKEAQLYIWVVNPTGRIDFRSIDLEILPSQQPVLSDLVLQIRQCLGIANENLRDATTATKVKPFIQKKYDPEPLRKLYRYLIQPIAELLPIERDAPVIFLPQGDLFLVPFSSLQDPVTKEFLIERHTILTAPSIQVLELTSIQSSDQEKKPSSNALIVGNPIMPSYGEPPDN